MPVTGHTGCRWSIRLGSMQLAPPNLAVCCSETSTVKVTLELPRGVFKAHTIFHIPAMAVNMYSGAPHVDLMPSSQWPQGLLDDREPLRPFGTRPYCWHPCRPSRQVPKFEALKSSLFAPNLEREYTPLLKWFCRRSQRKAEKSTPLRRPRMRLCRCRTS